MWSTFFDFDCGKLFQVAVNPFCDNDIEFYNLEGEITDENWMSIICSE